MAAFVSPERAMAASLTGAGGLLILAIAVVMMVIAAPTQVHGAHNPAEPSAVQVTRDLCHQLTSRSDSATVYACLAGPWAKEHASAF